MSDSSSKSPVVVKKEKMIVGIRAVLAVAMDPASRQTSRVPIPESPMELLNYACNREKLSWKLDFPSRVGVVQEYFLTLDDVLIVHLFCGSDDREEAKSFGCQLAIDRLTSIITEVREEEFNKGNISLAL